MKTAISIEDRIFFDAENLAQLMGLTRSALYTKALQEFVVHHLPSSLTEKYNQVYQKTSANSCDSLVDQVAINLLSQVEWDD